MMARRVIAGRSGFSPKALFANGEQGVWYDPSDFSTLFQDAAGTTPVTAVEQPVGLLLDKSKSLAIGTELVTNGNYSNGTTGWSSAIGASLSVVSGNLRVTNVPGNSGGRAYQAFSTVIGQIYKITGSIAGSNTTDYDVSIANVISGSGTVEAIAATIKSFIYYYRAISTTTYIRFISTGTSNAVYTDFGPISITNVAGNHAYQTTSANRPTLSARYNLLTKTEQFDDAYWIKYNISVTANNTTAPDGTLTADRLTTYGLSSTVYIITGYPAGTYTQSVYAKAGTNTHINFSTVSGGVSRVLFNLSTGIVDLADNCTAGMIDAGNGWYRCWMTFKSSGGFRVSYYTCTGLDTYVNGNYNYIWGADLRVANDGVGLPPYQRVNTATDYDTVGFPLYLRFNGSTQFLQTNSIGFSSTDKVLVAAGVRKLSNAIQAVVELSSNVNSNSGVFEVFCNLSNTIEFGSKGTLGVYPSSAVSAPATKVIGGLGDISGDSAILRINGAQAASSTADQGTGNYGNYPLYIGARGGSSLYFNGHLYSLIVRGAQTSANLIAATERYVARKTGVIL